MKTLLLVASSGLIIYGYWRLYDVGSWMLMLTTMGLFASGRFLGAASQRIQ